MSNYFRKIYINLKDFPHGQVEVSAKSLERRSHEAGATHYLQFVDQRMYTRIWVNLRELQVRRDLFGLYIADFRTEQMNDRVVCRREDRADIYKVRPDIGFCSWRELEDAW